MQQYQLVASGTTVAECERNYISLLAGSNLSTEEKYEGDAVTGTIKDIKTAVIDGNTNVFIKLNNDDFYYIISVEDSKLAAVLAVGDRVTVTPATSQGELRSAFGVERAK